MLLARVERVPRCGEPRTANERLGHGGLDVAVNVEVLDGDDLLGEKGCSVGGGEAHRGDEGGDRARLFSVDVTVGGQYGFYRSDDGAGASWMRLNDAQHQFGSLQGNYVAGDEAVFGRLYLTTGGRGYIYGDPQ